MSASDAGDYGPAFEHLARSVEAARRAGDLARLGGDVEAAASELEQA